MLFNTEPAAPIPPAYICLCVHVDSSVLAYMHVIATARSPPRHPASDADHHFSIRACDWGFREFVTLDELRDVRSGFLIDDKLMVSARVRVEPQINWWNWDSKKETLKITARILDAEY